MSFSAATCLTFNPTVQPSTGPFDIYLNSDYTSTPIVTGVDISLLTGNNCPYIIEVPDGTTNLGIKDTIKDYCITIPVQDNNICSNCNLGLSQYSATTIAKLYCGVLTGSCQITDYLINWYGPDSTTSLYLTSGPQGSSFNPDYTQPFSTSITAPSVPDGVYTPVIDKIIINGVTFSNTGGTNNVLFDGNCLPTTTVSPLYCFVKTNTSTDYRYSAYTNYLSFDSNTGAIPQQQTTILKVSASTKYVVWAFKGSDVPDRITLSFSGSYYSSLIGLEDFVVGSDLIGANFSASTYPKSANTSNFFIKYTCLTGLTINDNENIIIDITPAVSNTKWDLYISCLDDYECNDCINTQNYKIIGSSITGITENCDIIKVRFNISGCSYPDNSSDYMSYYLGNNSDFQINYYTYYSSFNNNIINSQPSLVNEKSYFTNVRCSNGFGQLIGNCNTDSSSSTTYNKTFLTDGSGRGVFGFTGSSTFISTYYNSIRNSFLGLTPYSSGWSGSTNSNDISYYRYYELKIPRIDDPENCGDNKDPINVFLHHTSPYLTGTTGIKYYLSITANTISKDINFGSCKIDCDSLEFYIINAINGSSTGNTSNNTTNREFVNGVYYTNPINRYFNLTSGNTIITAITYSSYFTTPDWSFNTYPFSGNPSTIIPSLSGSVCNFNNTGVVIPSYNSYGIEQYKHYYQTRLINPLNVNDFDIWASPITNFRYSGYTTSTPIYELAYRYSGGNVTFSSSTYIIG
tara:strand:+ start:1006 stop:3237 length:2232 start_codon:yes stop_codon:yes gene_type:complete